MVLTFLVKFFIQIENSKPPAKDTPAKIVKIRISSAISVTKSFSPQSIHWSYSKGWEDDVSGFHCNSVQMLAKCFRSAASCMHFRGLLISDDWELGLIKKPIVTHRRCFLKYTRMVMLATITITMIAMTHVIGNGSGGGACSGGAEIIRVLYSWKYPKWSSKG